MSAVDEFFESVRSAFARNRATDWRAIAPALAVALGVAIAVGLWIRRWRARRAAAQRIGAVATRARLGAADVAYLRGIAAATGLPALEVMTSLAPFEHATAEALAPEAPGTIRPPAGSAFERIRHLRKALGFSPLSPHLWLLSTRELSAGDSVAAGGVSGQVVDVNEASFAVNLPPAALPAVGAPFDLFINRPEDARYLARPHLLAVEPGRAFLAHDEAPERQQHREHVRVRAHGPVTVDVLDAPDEANPRTISGTMVDVSAGGMALELAVSPGNRIRRGAGLACSFNLGPEARFERLAAIVVAVVAGARPELQHLRLSFSALPPAVENRLAAALVQNQGRSSLDTAAS